MTLEFATVEWLWYEESIRINLPGGRERLLTGTYGEVVTTLSLLGSEGWDVAACAAEANWLFWTLRRQV